MEDSAGGKAVLSLGVRARVNVARLVEYVPGSDPTFMRRVLRIARRAGAAVALAYSTRSEFRDRLVAGGWRLRRTAPSSFAKGGNAFSLTAGATDVGFEAIQTSVSK